MAEKEHRILTATGPDQIGLVERISEFISRNGCSIEDSKMAVFAGEFAVIVLIAGDGASLTRISRDYREIETATGLSVAVKMPSMRKPQEPVLLYSLKAFCMDHPGIVYNISGILRRLGVNIDSMETKAYSAPMSGTPLFQLEADLAIPARTDLNHLRARLFELQSEEGIDIELSEIVP